MTGLPYGLRSNRQNQEAVVIRYFLTTSAADHASAPCRLRVLTTVLLSLHVTTGYAQQGDRYDYQQSTALTVGLGTQALMICNGLFVSNRTLEQVYEQELRLNRTTVLPPSMVTIDREAEPGGCGDPKLSDNVGGGSCFRSIQIAGSDYRPAEPPRNHWLRSAG